MQDSPLDEVWVTDTIEIPENQKFSKLKVSSIVPLITSEIKKMVK